MAQMDKLETALQLMDKLTDKELQEATLVALAMRTGYQLGKLEAGKTA